MRSKLKKTTVLVLIACMVIVMALTGCGSSGNGGSSDSSKAPDIEGLTYKSTMKLDYAKQFNVYYYEDGYELIDVKDDAQYLVIPKGKDKPKNLDKDIVVIKRPVKNIYMAATATMSLFAAMDGLDSIKMAGLRASEWSFDAPKKAMKSGKMVYAGKYSQPDYEMLLNKNCGLAVESTMINHTPEVKEMIEDLKIPVFTDRSSYETNPLGRVEWIKLYATLVGKEDEAEAFFKKQEKKISKLKDFDNTEKTVAFFYISTDGKAVVRRSTDYVPTMIRMAGGRYIFKDLDSSDGKTSIPMTIEKFYATAADADYIVYNGSIDSTVRSLSDLKAKDPIMKKFKAVKNGNCWVTGTSMYQRTDVVGDMILDFHKLFTEKNPDNLKFITKLE